MSRVIDPEGAHLAALHRLADFNSQRIIELGCGDGRLTVNVAVDAESVLAFSTPTPTRSSEPAALSRLSSRSV